MDWPDGMGMGENFRLLTDDELPQLLNFLARYLPESLKFHQTVLTYMRHKVWDFRFYVANKWPDDAICLHFPGMTLSPHGLPFESVGVFCPNHRLELLKLLREEDILIDWSKPLYINFVHYDIAQELMRLYEDIGTVDTMVGDVFVCANFDDLDCGEETDEDADPDIQVKPLRPEHAEGIHELYPANDMECHQVFRRLIRTLPAAGVFVKDKLAAWMVQSYYGAMFSMQTKPQYRRKGYGTKLVRYLTKRVADKGYQPFVVIRPENEASQSLYKKLGFGKLYQTVRMTFMPFARQDQETETSRNLRENLENTVRQLTIEQKVVDAFRCEEEICINEESVEDKEEIPENTAEDPEEVIEEPDEGSGEGEIVAAEETEDRIKITEESTAVETAEDSVQDTAQEALNDDGGNQDSGGTADSGDAE